MIDLHSHILPGCDDGAEDLETAIAMARIAVNDGVRVMACTPHILPGLYDNDSAGIEVRVTALREALVRADVDLTLVMGADVHIALDLRDKLDMGSIPTINGSRYFLFEPPHQVMPPNIETLVKRLIDAGYVPILTHPERLGWTNSHYDVIHRINVAGCLIQITAAALVGGFGRRAQSLADRMLEEGRVDIIASDAHNTHSRLPGLSKARDMVEARYGKDLADDLVIHRPKLILENKPIASALSTSNAAASWSGQPRVKPMGFSRFVEWIKNV
ncbi:CpsB/CapC family capsule biosynthesis tyrosine phosphatase [Ochrobactrum sp. A-1]|uniref:CpsB/CapC family capsule biosynthesis tyrosine phosphatase n=1 Tax=Ochrobactrum sp. A-1 TaxID=2920940 RepID=UPI001F0A9847|nr:capsular biosynthesis protein [Ochrobactrum sp. A-1]